MARTDLPESVKGEWERSPGSHMQTCCPMGAGQHQVSGCPEVVLQALECCPWAEQNDHSCSSSCLFTALGSLHSWSQFLFLTGKLCFLWQQFYSLCEFLFYLMIWKQYFCTLVTMRGGVTVTEAPVQSLFLWCCAFPVFKRRPSRPVELCSTACLCPARCSVTCDHSRLLPVRSRVVLAGGNSMKTNHITINLP